MSRELTHRIGDLQLRILQVLWDLAEADVAGVQAALAGAPLAYTTVATMLRKMEERGMVHHRAEGRKFIYRAIATAEDISRSMSDNLVDRLFAGSLADTVSHLLQTREVDPAELLRLERLIQDRKKGR